MVYTVEHVTPGICMVCKTYVGKGNLCGDAKCKKIMKSQVRSLLDDMRRRTTLAEKLRERIRVIISKFGLNAELLDESRVRNVFVRCDDTLARDIIIMTIMSTDENYEIRDLEIDGVVTGVGVSL